MALPVAALGAEVQNEPVGAPEQEPREEDRRPGFLHFPI